MCKTLIQKIFSASTKDYACEMYLQEKEEKELKKKREEEEEKRKLSLLSRNFKSSWEEDM